MISAAALALAIPLHVEPVRSKRGATAGFSAVTGRYALRLTDEGASLYFRGGAVRLKIPRTRPEGMDELAAPSNYYVGSDPAEWRTGVPNYARVRYADVFPAWTWWCTGGMSRSSMTGSWRLARTLARSGSRLPGHPGCRLAATAI